MQDDTTTPEAKRPADHAARPMPCITCGYDLRGLPAEGVCPECATPVERSRVTDELRHADPTWLKGVSRGCVLLVTSVVLFVISTVIPFMMLIMIDDMATIQILEWLMIGGVMSGYLLVILGLFLITAQEPRDVLSEDDVSNRRVTRACTLAVILLWAINFIVDPPWTIFVNTAGLICFIIGLTGALIRLRRLALRIPDTRLALFSRRSATRVAVLGAILITLSIISTFRPGLPTWPTGLAMLVWGLAVLRALALFGRFRNAVVGVGSQPSAGALSPRD